MVISNVIFKFKFVKFRHFTSYWQKGQGNRKHYANSNPTTRLMCQLPSSNENFSILTTSSILNMPSSCLIEWIYQYVVVIARCRVQYGKYFPSFSYFATYFTSLQVSEITAKYEKRGKYFPYCTRDCAIAIFCTKTNGPTL